MNTTNNNREIIITGATSALSSEVIKVHLNNNVKVHAIIRPNSTRKDELVRKFPDINLCEIDSDDFSSDDAKEMLKKAKNSDAFFHFAWEGVKRIENNDSLSQAKNISNSLNALKLFKELTHKGNQNQTCRPKFIFAGSQGELGRGVRTQNPLDAYSISKLCSGKLLKLLAWQLDIKYVYTRIFTTYGLHNRTSSLLEYIIPKFMQNEEVNLSPCEQNWDWLHFSDAAVYFYRLGSPEYKTKDDDIYEIGCGQGKPLKEYVMDIHKMLKSSSIVNFGTKEYDPAQQGLDFLANTKSLVDVTKYLPQVDFETGISEVIKSYGSLSR